MDRNPASSELTSSPTLYIFLDRRPRLHLRFFVHDSKSDADSKNRGAPTSCLNQEASPGYSTSSLPSTSWNAKKPKDVIRKKRYSRLQKPL
ncbi:hypothetical protein ZEAMMB73_Zm00001d014643 [Zea mays]|uniref:Uncharacterized protein n=1 Tax=Zea mays TaxID=4577 RepID=A0A1D6GUT7_MAIZE|nr:hypothetical protein ZEAMMB73_Zm00001d014643 [Zea mays]